MTTRKQKPTDFLRFLMNSLKNYGKWQTYNVTIEGGEGLIRLFLNDFCQQQLALVYIEKSSPFSPFLWYCKTIENEYQIMVWRFVH